MLAALQGCLGQIDDARRTLRTYRQITDAPALERVSQIFVNEEQRAIVAEGIHAAECA